MKGSDMELKDKIAVVTGGGSGIGEGLCRRFVEEGAKAVVVADIVGDDAERVAAEIGGIARTVDVANEEDIKNLIEDVEANVGPIDLFVSNAGIGLSDPTHVASASNEGWQRIWEINVMAHVYAARYMLPLMLERGHGYLLNTASAAGLLSQIGSAAYSVTKAGAVAFAESLSIAHGDQGIGVSVLCPQAVRSKMTAGHEDGVASGDGLLEPAELAETTIQCLREERFLVLPHAEVLTYIQRKAGDYDRWLGGMRRWRDKFLAKR
jgi:NAD(P)-dependent dehydrogenase (short-subunit alcohol dehydrogenase family)